MPLKTRAADINAGYTKTADARIDDAVKARLSAVKAVTRFALARLDAAMEQHFAAADKAGTTPYPDEDRHGQPTVTLRAFDPDDFQSGNHADVEQGLLALVEHEDAVCDKLNAALIEAGFQARFDPSFAGKELQVTIWDPKFSEPDHDRQVDTRFQQALAKDQG